MLAFLAQFGVGTHAHRGDLLAPLAALILAACGGGLLLGLLERTLPRTRRALRRRAASRRRLLATANAERRARAMMDELCPHGWRAQITMAGTLEGPPDHLGAGEHDWVALDWAAYEDASSRVEVVRRVWAPTIGDALDAMVADRRTDETLEHIEQAALADDALWPDL